MTGKTKTRHLLPLRTIDADVMIVCKTGTLWVTQSGNDQDYLMAAGDTLRLQGKGWVAEALSDSEWELLEKNTLKRIEQTKPLLRIAFSRGN